MRQRLAAVPAVLLLVALLVPAATGLERTYNASYDWQSAADFSGVAWDGRNRLNGGGAA